MSNTYTGQDVAETFKHYADYLQNEIDSFNRVDTLPLVGARLEIAARKKAAEILIPVQQMFVQAAHNFHIETELEKEVQLDKTQIEW